MPNSPLEKLGLCFQRSAQPLAELVGLAAQESPLPPLLSAELHLPAHPHRVLLEVRSGQALVGFSLSETYPWHRTAQIEFLFILPAYRKQGLGRQLFAFTAELLVQEEQACSLEVLYDTALPFTAALESILVSLGWPRGHPWLIRCHFAMERFCPAWLYDPDRFPSSVQLFPWKELTAADRAWITHRETQGPWRPYLGPLQYEPSIDWELSMGLRHQGRVAGWCLVTQSGAARRYASLYVDRELVYRGYGIRLLAASLRRQKERDLPEALFEANVVEIAPSWRRFIQKRLLPAAARVERIKRACRVLALPLT